ncbi:protease SohB [Buchnera aphidicola]|uniref:protease SohB n=1 Tax=Buchnera aphidicola TaxID=9 RepID=UPI003464B500
MNFILNYGLFLIKNITVLASVLTIILVITHIVRRKNENKGKFKLTLLGEKYNNIKENILFSKMTSYEKKVWNKINKKKQKNNKNMCLKNKKPTLYVLDFKGDLYASAVSYLRKEISAILSVAKENDEVLLRLESSGGTVHGYGFAAVQLQRLRQKGIYLTVSVDKIAASGGYMMASVANHIMAAPFSIIGSIGVVAQIPNFNKILKKNNIDIELHTAGRYKRTLTLFGENTQAAREKFCCELDITYHLFKDFIHEMRPILDIEAVSTGEYWFGSLALKKNLIDSIDNSDDFLISKRNKFTLLEIKYTPKKNVMNNIINNILKKIYSMIMK